MSIIKGRHVQSFYTVIMQLSFAKKQKLSDTAYQLCAFSIYKKKRKKLAMYEKVIL